MLIFSDNPSVTSLFYLLEAEPVNNVIQIGQLFPVQSNHYDDPALKRISTVANFSPIIS